MKTQLEKQALSLTAVGRLKMAGCVIKSINNTPMTPVIDIDKPPFKLRSKAHRITEVLHGMVNQICVASYSGCLVRWVDDGMEITAELCQKINPYSPELISQWPKIF